METNLENLKALVTEHRQGKRRGQYPAKIWESALELRKQHTVEEISRSTGLHRTLIYKRTSKNESKRTKAVFREVQIALAPNLAKSVAVELRRVDGAELRVRIEATSSELSSLFMEFLR
jgi:hypothetical protein